MIMVTPQQMSDMIDEYNYRYFDGDLKSNFVVNLDKRIKSYGRCHAPVNHTIKIDVNPKLMYLDNRIIKNTLVHEMIHAWQFENGYSDEENDMHGESFNKWCAYIKYNNGMNIQQYATDSEQKKFDQESSCYYVYDGEWGYFTKILYDTEANRLKHKGFKVFFLQKPVMKWVKYQGFTDPMAHGPNRRVDAYRKEFILSPLKYNIEDIDPDACYKPKQFNSEEMVEV